ncbi:MAG: hypothetical protein HRU14_13110 [Planctomycetes bacterium]|nr:hypothetical protein [Planctomycetota bacterium]
MDASHAIFNKPFKVELTWIDLKTPKHYSRYPEGAEMGETIKAWRVHRELRRKDYGLVSGGYGFEDTPDCEFISGGNNSKGPNSVALGRQGNFFLWGFCAPPMDMTEEARTVFLNTLVYMRGFDGKRAFARRTAPSRRWAFVYAGYLDDERLQKYGTRQFSKALLDEAKGSGATMKELLAANEAYLFRAARHVSNGPSTFSSGYFAVDADAKALGIANRDPAILERCVTELEQGEKSERALILLQRYTDQELLYARDWRVWLDANKDHLYFTDTGGYKFKLR